MLRRVTLYAGLLFASAVLAAAAKTPNDVWGYLFDLKQHKLFALHGDVMRVGRLANADVMLSDGRVSRRHAEIRREPEGVHLVDVGSSNGTRLNGRGLAPDEPGTLAPGDLVQFAEERLLYHEQTERLWMDALEHVLIGRLVRLQIPVLADRESTSFGSTRMVAALTRAVVDPSTGTTEVDFGERRDADGGFDPKEGAVVGHVKLAEGALLMSLWGLERGGSMVSRRSSFSKVKHGELRLEAAGGTEKERQNNFQAGFQQEGLDYLLPLLRRVLEPAPEGDVANISRDFARDLIEQPTGTAARDATAIFALLHRQNPADADFPALAAQARARWVKSTASARKAVLSERERSELRAALAESRDWASKALALGAKEKALAPVEAEIQEAEKLLREN
jgi:hypothetical protein